MSIENDTGAMFDAPVDNNGIADVGSMFDMLSQYIESDGNTPFNQARKDYQEPGAQDPQKKAPVKKEPEPPEEGETEPQEEEETKFPSELPDDEPQEDPKGWKPFKVKVGDQEFEIKSETQVAKLVERSKLAGELYTEYQKIEKEHKELSEDIDYLETLAKEDPQEFLDTVTEELSQEELIRWMKQKIEFFKLSGDERKKYDEFKEAKAAKQREQILRQKLEETKKAEERLKQQQEVVELKKVQSHLESKYIDVVGKDWFNTVVKLQVQEAARLQAAGEQVSLQRFRRMIESVVEPVYVKLKPKQNAGTRLKAGTKAAAISQGAPAKKGLTDASEGFDMLLKAIEAGLV